MYDFYLVFKVKSLIRNIVKSNACYLTGACKSGAPNETPL